MPTVPVPKASVIATPPSISAASITPVSINPLSIAPLSITPATIATLMPKEAAEEAPWSHTGIVTRAAIALGANIGEPAAQIARGVQALMQLPHTRVIASSGLYQSAAVGYTAQPDFFNAVALIDTQMSAPDLLAALLEIERQQGRVRDFPNAPRTLDLDLLVYGDTQCELPGLTIPHPRMLQRAFVLVPLHEIAAQLQIPEHGQVRDLLSFVDVNSVQRCGDIVDAHLLAPVVVC